MVLLVADGPTIYDLATAAIALLGLGLSAYSIRRQVKRETRSVKLSCRYGFPVGPISSVAPEELICVELVNEGHRPVEVTGVGFELKDGRQPLVMPLPLEGPVNFPRTLSDGGVLTFYFDAAELKAAEKGVGQAIRKAFVDASGSRFRGPFVRR